MFSTFTGNSRRPRNVNLSGQRNTNPWANSNWGSAPSGASQTVANAQAEREKRQKEREELAASKCLQRVWRGHRARRSIQIQHRDAWDRLYSSDSPRDPAARQERAQRALPLLLNMFDPTDLGDQRRLAQFTGDFSVSAARDLEARQWDKLASLLVAALERLPVDSSQPVLDLLDQIMKARPSSITIDLDRYYKVIASSWKQLGWLGSPGGVPDDYQGFLAEALVTPLNSQPGESDASIKAYEAFSFSFLTCEDIAFLEENPAQVAKSLNLQSLSSGIINAYTKTDRAHRVSRDDLLWLLAHFITLHRVASNQQGALYLEALYLQLSELAADIRLRSASEHEPADQSSDEEDDFQASNTGPLPPYIAGQLEFLVNEDGIMELLSRFTSTATSSARMSEDASMLAGYTLVLLRCFPSHGDDIKMRLFHGDVTTMDSGASTTLPSVKFFWKAVSQSQIFSAIAHDRSAQKSKPIITLLQPEPSRDPQWRTVLLFLELYGFLLRVTDDEDFLPAGAVVTASSSPAVLRIRSSSLSVAELKALASFLKNLSFPLYYNLADIMPSNARSSDRSVSTIFNTSTVTTTDTVEKAPTGSFAGIAGMDVLSLRESTTATMRSLYERDSRRSFLPKDFWLMTSKFDMEGFLSAVILEEQRKDEAENEDEEMSDAETDRLDSFHTASGHRISRAAQIERQRQHKKIQREKLLAQVGPKLEILRNMPFTIPFEVRVQIFRQFVHLDKMKRRGGYIDPDQWRLWVVHGDMFNSTRSRDVLGRHTAQITRGQVFEDALDHFYSLGPALKEPIQITFIDQFGQPEAGIDGGGVTKEFLTSVTNEAFNPDRSSLFVANSQNLLYPNPTAFDEHMEQLKSSGIPEDSPDFASNLQELSKRYEFLGRIVGKCMYEGILIDIAFANFFLLKWSSSGQTSNADFRASLNDLRDLDPDLYRGLINLKNYPGDVSDLSLDFTITDRVENPVTGEVQSITRSLRKDGENITVTNKDRPLYISYVAHHRLVAQPYRQTKAFLRGLGMIINPSWLSMFNQSELQRLVGGDSSEIDVDDLRRNTQYSGLYVIGDDKQEHDTIKMFWEVMYELEDTERREVLKYVTSTPRAPLLGFKQLNPPFSIRDGGIDQERLPSTSTCVNLLKLPRYTSKATLKSKLIYAVQSGAGFDLS